MDHEEAVRIGAAERYLLGELTSDERDRYEEHYFGCPACAAEVRAGAAFLDNARAALGSPERLSAPAPTDVREAAQPVRPVQPVFGRPRWSRLPASLAAALAVSLGAVSYQSAWVIPKLRERAEAPRPVPPPQPLPLTRGDELELRARPSDADILVLLAPIEGYASYRAHLEDPDGRIVFSTVVAAPPSGDELYLVVPTLHLRPNGRHVLALTGVGPASPQLPAEVRYPFIFKRLER